MKIWVKFIFAIQVLQYALAETERVSCELTWVSSGYGNTPKNAVECSHGINSFAGRAFTDGKWWAGTVLPSDGKIVISKAGTLLEFPTYQVLINPGQCKLSWIDDKGGNVPKHSVNLDSTSSRPLFIGRGVSSGESFCGSVDIFESKLHLANEESVVDNVREYQVLISMYSALVVELSEFKFELSGIPSRTLTKQILGQEEIELQGGVAKSTITYDVLHQKIFEEYFEFSENTLKFFGLGLVNVSFVSLFGSEDFNAFQVIPNKFNGNLEVRKKRAVEVRTKYNGEAPPQAGAPRTHLQLCSIINVLQNANIPFSAVATYKADELKTEHLEIIMNGLGRTFIPPTMPSSDFLKGNFAGVLVGKFVVNTVLVVEDVDPTMLCWKYRI